MTGISMRAAGIGATALAMVTTATSVCPRVAAAEDMVTYEVVSDTVAIVNLQYVAGQKVRLHGIPLPWRLDITVPQGIDRSEIRADWRPNASPSRWVTVRILRNGEVLCQSTLDIGNATCYGNTPHIA